MSGISLHEVLSAGGMARRCGLVTGLLPPTHHAKRSAEPHNEIVEFQPSKVLTPGSHLNVAMQVCVLSTSSFEKNRAQPCRATIESIRNRRLE